MSRIKDHFDRNKDRYIAFSVGATITYIVVKNSDIITQTISDSTIETNVVGNYNTINNITNPVRNIVSHIIQDQDGNTYLSQNECAIALGVHKNAISKHILYGVELPNGDTLTKIGERKVSA